MSNAFKALCFLLLFQLPYRYAQAEVNQNFTPVNLKCELRKNPLGIDMPNPGLSFIINAAGVEPMKQTAYQIWVSNSPTFKNGGDLWDTKKVEGDQMAYISYSGKPLTSGQQCWWKVRVWNQSGQASDWSKPATWTMGILKDSDWKAEWITAKGAEKFALSPVGYRSKPVADNEVKWVQVDLGQPRRFSEINLYPSFFEDRAAFGFPIRFQILSSNDASFKTSETLADYTDKDYRPAAYAPAHILTKNAKARYVRVLVSKAPRAGFSLRQIEIMDSGKNIAAGSPVQAYDNNENDGFNKNNLTDRVADYHSFPNFSSIMMRKEFPVKPALIRAVMFVSGLSQYELSINGKKIGNYLLTPGWTDYRKTVLYDTYDVTRQLQAGKNAIGIILGNGVYNIQPDTLRYVKFITTFGPAKACAQLKLWYADGSVKTVITDKSWQVSPGPITYSNLYGGEDYDANLEPNGWNKADFSAGPKWVSALETSGPGGSLKGLSCAAPPVTAIDTFKAAKITRIKENLWIYDFGQNASMMPALTVRGAAGTSVRMTPSELLGADGLVDRSSATQSGVRPAWWQYILKGTSTEKWFPKFFYQGARYLQVELIASPSGSLPKIINLDDIIVHSSSQPVGKFSCSNSLFNRIYNLVRWAQRSNMMSLMTDCPHREKMGWLEENQLNGPSLRYSFDMSTLFRKTMNDMADAQLDNGLVPNIAPEYFIAGSPDISNGMRNSPEWGGSFIIVPWQQYLFSGDITLLSRYYDRMKKYLNFLAGEAKNHIIYTGLGDWYDIGPKEPWGSQLTPEPFTATAIYYYDNIIMGNVAKALNKPGDAIAFEAEAAQIKASFNQKFYHAETGLYATGSQTTCAMPLFFNLVEPQGRQKLLNALVADIKNRNNSFTSGEVGYRFLLQALANGGRSDVVYDMNNQSDKPGYGYQLKMGATSLTEKWDAGVGNFGSQNHFMSGQINEWFFNSLVGINPDENGPGYRKFIIKPAFIKDLQWVKGSYQSVSGDIECSWKRTGSILVVDVTVPANTTATAYFPGDITADSKSSTISYLRSENETSVYYIPSGKYHLIIKEKG